MPKRIVRPEKSLASKEVFKREKRHGGIFQTHHLKRLKKHPLTQPGYQTVVGRNVRKFAAMHPGTSPAVIDSLIQGFVSKVKLVPASLQEAKKFYAKQTAEDIMASKKIPVVFLNDPQFPERIYPAFGCNSLCTALAAVLRSKGIPTVFVRLKNSPTLGLGAREGESHVVLIFGLEGSQFIADPFNPSSNSRMIPFTPEVQRKFAALEKEGFLSVGKDSWDLGVSGFEKYNFFKKTRFFQKP